MRKNIYEIINTRNIDMKKEYSRIYDMFYLQPYNKGLNNATLREHISESFLQLDKRLIHRCLSLDDFNETYQFRFVEEPKNFDIDYFVSFAEYVTNLTYAFIRCGNKNFNHKESFRIINHIKDCMEDFGYQSIEKEQIIIYIEKNPVAISVSENTDDELSYSVLEYNHYRLKGDLINKKNILKNMADDIETKRPILKSIDESFTSNLFQMLNKFIRHDSSENTYISNLQPKELEQIYDEIYQMWLMAKMLLEQRKRNEFISEIISKINEN